MGRHLPYGITQCYLPPDTSERAPPNPSHAGGYSIYLPRREWMEGWVDLVDLIAPQLGVEPTIFRSRVRRRTAAPPRHSDKIMTVVFCPHGHDLAVGNRKCVFCHDEKLYKSKDFIFLTFVGHRFSKVKLINPCLLLSSSTGYQVSQHGFQISKHVRACRHVKIGPVQPPNPRQFKHCTVAKAYIKYNDFNWVWLHFDTLANNE